MSTLQRKALDLISVEVTSGPPPAVTEIASQETVITAPWLHPAIHDHVPALSVHLVGAYHGERGASVWRNGRMRLKGTGRVGSLAIVPAQFWGHWDVDGTAPLSYVLLSDARLQTFAEEACPRGGRVELLPRVGEPDPVGAHIVRALGRMAAHPEGVESVHLEQALDLLCFHLLRVHSAAAPSPAAAQRRGLLPWQVRRVISHMRDRLDRDISLNELAALLDLSRFHFCTAFRLATGQTPYECLTALRIERARVLLGNPALRITDIALMVGYSTPSAFAASFRKIAGMTPTDFRRAM